mmetsp:Transcript_4884/g.11142  ORF Transcript_4884/g.11142 Transcript_4884/m.11142 type:complete len:400 (-) Transcript_4884:216-1415(-)
MGYTENNNERSRNPIRGWAVTLLYPSMLLFTILNLKSSTFSRELTKLGGGASPSSSSAASHHNYVPLLDSSSSSQEMTGLKNKDLLFSHQLETEAKRLLSHVLVTISYWHSPTEKEVKFLGHTLGTIREWRLLPQIGNVTVVIVTNNAASAKESLGRTNGDWYTFHQVDTKGQPYHMPFYHREVVADYIDRHKEDGRMNMTEMLNKELPPPSSYSFFEADNVLDGAGLLAWARDTALLLHHQEGEEEGTNNHIRHFWRWEWNTLQGCAVFTGQIKPIPRNSSDRIITIGGKHFVSMTGGGIWAGMYVLTSQHMLNYYNSGSFWNLPNKYKYAREIQLHDVVHGNDTIGRPDKNDGDNTIVPIDGRTGTVDVIAGVHHQSDKYVDSPWGFSKLCVDDLFN